MIVSIYLSPVLKGSLIVTSPSSLEVRRVSSQHQERSSRRHPQAAEKYDCTKRQQICFAVQEPVLAQTVSASLWHLRPWEVLGQSRNGLVHRVLPQSLHPVHPGSVVSRSVKAAHCLVHFKIHDAYQLD